MRLASERQKYLDIMASEAQADSSRKAGDPSANNNDLQLSVVDIGIGMTGSGKAIKVMCEKSHLWVKKGENPRGGHR